MKFIKIRKTYYPLHTLKLIKLNDPITEDDDKCSLVFENREEFVQETPEEIIKKINSLNDLIEIE